MWKRKNAGREMIGEDQAQIDENAMTHTTWVLSAEVEQREDIGWAEEYFLEIVSGRGSPMSTKMPEQRRSLNNNGKYRPFSGYRIRTHS
jgi:hypothetical protein